MQLSIDNLRADMDILNEQLIYIKSINDYYYQTTIELLNSPYTE